MEEEIRVHLYKRITSIYRYTPEAINAALEKAIPDLK